MKKLLIFAILSFCFFMSKSQTDTFPVKQNLGSAKTLVQIPNYGGIRGGLIPFTFTDTSQANTLAPYLKNYAGALIYTSTPRAIFWRDLVGQAWVQVLPSASPTGTAGWTLGGNDISARPDSSVLGTTSYDDWFLISNDRKFMAFSKDGIADSGVNVVPVGIDTVTKEFSYARASGGGGGAFLPIADTANMLQYYWNKGDTLFLTTLPLYYLYNTVTHTYTLHIDTASASKSGIILPATFTQIQNSFSSGARVGDSLRLYKNSGDSVSFYIGGGGGGSGTAIGNTGNLQINVADTFNTPELDSLTWARQGLEIKSTIKVYTPGTVGGDTTQNRYLWSTDLEDAAWNIGSSTVVTGDEVDLQATSDNYIGQTFTGLTPGDSLWVEFNAYLPVSGAVTDANVFFYNLTAFSNYATVNYFSSLSTSPAHIQVGVVIPPGCTDMIVRLIGNTAVTGKIHFTEPGLKDHSYYSYIATGATAEPPTAQSGTDTVIHFMATPDSVVSQGLPSTSNATDSLVGVNTNGRWGLVGKNTLSYWGLSGNSGTAGTGVIGTTDAQPFSFISNNITRATLSSAGQLSTTDNMLINGAKVGSGNESTSVVLGVSALASTTSANANVAIGYNSMNLLTSSIGNVAIGYNSMGASAVTGGNNNTIGSNSAGALTSGQRNNMYGAGVGNNLTTGSYNNFLGYRSGLGIVTGSYNTVLGNIEGLPSDLHKNIIIGDGFGNRRINGDSSGNIGINTITPTQRLHVNGRVRIDTLTSGAATDSIVVWSPTDSTLKKMTMASLVAGSVPLSGITAATGSNTITNTSHAQQWDWNALGANAIAFSLRSTGTSMSGTTKLFNSSIGSGASSSSGDVYTGYFNNSVQAASGTAYGIDVSAANSSFTATASVAGRFVANGSIGSNYAIIVPSNSGSVGIGISSPTSTLHVDGAIAKSITTKTATYTAANDYTILCSTNTFTINLPTASGITGRIYIIKNITSGTTITVDGSGSETIDGATTYTLASQYKYVQIQSTGSEWVVTGNN